MLEKIYDCSAIMMKKQTYDLLRLGKFPTSDELGKTLSEFRNDMQEWLRQHHSVQKFLPLSLSFYEIENPDPNRYVFKWDRNEDCGFDDIGLVTIELIEGFCPKHDVRFCRAMKKVRLESVDDVSSALYDYSLTSRILSIQKPGNRNIWWSIDVLVVPSSDGQTNIDACLIQKFMELNPENKVCCGYDLQNRKKVV